MSDSIEVTAVNMSVEKGTVKSSVDKAEVSRYGIVGDAHSGPWHRQVSLLGEDSVTRFQQETGRKIAPGEFAENLLLHGIDLREVNLFDRFVKLMEG